MNKRMRIGVYGGTFSPPHLGHIEAAKVFSRQMKLDELYIIPAHIPPHKALSDEVSGELRAKMCRIAFEGVENSSVSTLEIERGGTSYTYLTLESLYAEDKEIFFLCGTDMFLTLDQWRCPERIFELASICFVRREDDAENDAVIEQKTKLYTERYGARIHQITKDVLEISSTELRDRIHKGIDCSEFLPEGVLKFIEDWGLYR